MRRSLAPAFAVGALALAAAPALAAKTEPPNQHQFTGSANVEPRFSGEGEFTLKPFTITCEKEKSTSSGVTPVFPSKTLTAVVKYSGCTAEATLDKAEYELKARVRTPVTFNYHANGVVEVGAGGTINAEGKLEGAGSVEISVSGPFKCTIDVAAGVYPANSLKKPEAQYEAATFENQEETITKGKSSLLLKRLAITTALTKMPYEFEGEYCEALSKTEYTSGTYAGSLLAEIKKGQLSWEEAPPA
jgi:hypothetical protein